MRLLYQFELHQQYTHSEISFKQESLLSTDLPKRGRLHHHQLVLCPGEIDIRFRVIPEPKITDIVAAVQLFVCSTIRHVLSVTDHVVGVPLVELLTFRALVPIGEPGLPIAAAHYATPLFKVITS